MSQRANVRSSPRKSKRQEIMPLDENALVPEAAAGCDEAGEDGLEQEQATPRPSRSGASGRGKIAARSGVSPQRRVRVRQDPLGLDGTTDIDSRLQLGVIPELQALQVTSGFSVELASVGVGSSITRAQSRSQSSAASSSAASGSPRRPKSPVKQLSDLQFASRPIVFGDIPDELPLDVADLYQRLKDISDGIGIAPAVIRDRIAAVGGRKEPLRPWTTNDDIAISEADAEVELNEILEIREAASLCTAENLSEAAWNDEVHSRLLRLALRSIPGVRHYNITTARICPELTARHISGDILSSKLVDYSINILPSKDAWKSMRDLLGAQPYPLQTINQTRYDGVRFKPCAVSIETKVQSNEQDGKIQLGMWSSAYFARIRRLQQDRDDAAGLPSEESGRSASTVTLPLLLANTHNWSLLFARDREDCIEVMGELRVGDTASLHGLYKLLSTLRLLAEWSNSTFREWIESEVLGMELSA
ncbi:hypothetical protein H2199_008944 [Coniosporium tulheliwenetii]|uniref:Uncharacterized protein n=1 Tax=Coniosporium tulheliwenetii TaxID=3383036 RepID=A0ACC2YH70_9PEZI|nr:hypothetical protein H2199_008944 [Cladosporium sp. JES 115]